ncbi:MAG: VOC family protein [Pseudomonadota bacterium]
MSVPTITQLTPFVLVSNLEKALAFYEGVLEFECTFRADNYAFIRWEKAAIRLFEVGCDIDLQDEKRQQSLYIDVDGLDALYERLEAMLSMLPSGRVRAPFNQDYGQREFHVVDEDALLIFFGEALPK